jgi:hypothetical protein
VAGAPPLVQDYRKCDKRRQFAFSIRLLPIGYRTASLFARCSDLIVGAPADFETSAHRKAGSPAFFRSMVH